MKFTSYLYLALEAAAVSSALPKGGHGGQCGDHGNHNLVSPDKLIKRIKLKDLLAGEQKLQDFAYSYPARNRVFGEQAHKDTVDYLYNELKKTGYYDVFKQEQVHLWSSSNQTFSVNGKSLDAKSMTYSPSGEAKAELVLVNNLGCQASDFPAEVSGKIALIHRGECTFSDKSALAGAAKAAGAVIYNNVPGELSGTLGSPTNPLGEYPPTVGISQEIGEDLVSRIGSETLTANLWVLTLSENRTTWNVIAETKGGDHNNVVALGAHTDSVEAGPGINDDGSGTISNLVIAKELTKFCVKNAVRFGFWTAEEYGLLGSTFYVGSLSEAERAKVALYLNFDMIASPNYANMIYDGDGSAFNVSGPPGSAEIEALFEKFYDDQNLPHIPTEFDGRSDYQGFIDAGIPAGGLFTGAEGIMTEDEAKLFGGKAGIAYDANYHGVGDTMDNLAHDAFLLNSQATAYAVATYALSTESLPKRDTAPTKRAYTNKPVRGFNGKCSDNRRCTY